MQLADIIEDVNDMSDEDLGARLVEIRNRRLQAPERVKKAERKKTAVKKSSADSILSGMSKEDIQKLLKRYEK